MKVLVVLSAACGVGKSTVKDALNQGKLSDSWTCIDTDEVGVNWWDYAGTENESAFSDKCLEEAVKLSGNRNLLFVTCLNPCDFYKVTRIPEAVASTYFIGMTCSNEEITKRLKARPAERMCGSNAFISDQVQYNNWYRKNSGKFQYFIDNTDMTIDETANKIAAFINVISNVHV